MIYRPCWLCGGTVNPEPQAAWNDELVRVSRNGVIVTETHVHQTCRDLHAVAVRRGRTDLSTIEVVAKGER